MKIRRLQERVKAPNPGTGLILGSKVLDVSKPNDIVDIIISIKLSIFDIAVKDLLTFLPASLLCKFINALHICSGSLDFAIDALCSLASTKDLEQ